ncbi:hypothetical protein HAX54_018842 [Datura stramonium]|uniref:Uncharacterized protein n=1 Tax=Datura stramonium TaxID=4076 RepID=A0ABS8RJT0_DATST|nr:hypothetical protein [Datura stramonium]
MEAGYWALMTSDVVDDGAYPLELDTILDKMTLFKVVVKRSNIEDLNINCGQVPDEDKEIMDFNPYNDMITPTNTPTKRSILEIESCVIEVNDDFSAQLSSNKSKKVVKRRNLLELL